MPLNAQKLKVDGWVNARLPAFRDTQDAWLTAKGQYFQGLGASKTRRTNGADAPTDNLDAHPTDQSEDWNAFLSSAQVPIVVPPAIPAQLIFNVYQGPGGWGWELVTEFLWSGLLYRKVWNTGPETGPDEIGAALGTTNISTDALEVTPEALTAV